DVVHDFKKGFTVPCTGCRYCTPNCPMQLDIPVLLKAYNDYKYERTWENNLRNIEEDKLPSKCIGCGSCMEHCPQNIEIPTYMKKLARLNETGKEE
ncbi:MAG: 4Fe-4S dicluster domain-containing protein, partial [Spirochaetales bacterium]|nr:4Fe-4S dicluster domain-containing protein [Spirochaetales bacterium]